MKCSRRTDPPTVTQPGYIVLSGDESQLPLASQLPPTATATAPQVGYRAVEGSVQSVLSDISSIVQTVLVLVM